MNDQNIADYISSIVQQHGEILGSQLGSHIKDVFPQFQGLKGFIERCCRDRVVIVRRYGPDFIYAPASYGIPSAAGASTSGAPQPTPIAGVPPPPSSAMAPQSTLLHSFSPPVPLHDKISFARLPQRPIRPRNRLGYERAIGSNSRSGGFWSAFTNPTLNDLLAIDKASTTLRVLPQHSLLEPPLIEVPKVTVEEHRQTAIDFVAHIDPVDRPHFQSVASAPDPGPMWFWRIKDFAGGKYSSSWLDFRTSAFEKLFKERLIQLGLEQTAIEGLVVKFLETKHRRFRYDSEIPPGQPYSSPSASIPIAGDEDAIRRIARTAISQMSPDELRHLWLPLGAIVNSLRGQ